MNYVTQTLIDIYKERFADDKPYLSEKLEELEAHENKYDGLDFLCSKADRTTIKQIKLNSQLQILRYLKICGIRFNKKVCKTI